MDSLSDLTAHLHHGHDLDAGQIGGALTALLDEHAADDQKAAFLRSLRTKGESADEITGFVHALLQRSVDPEIDSAKISGPMLDICGTGGDRSNLFNVSTTAMFVLAAGGAAVVKHGNRGITSKCGGADVLEALGVRIDLTPADFRRCLEENSVGFMFAPNYHPAFKAIASVRKTLAAQGVTTIFNVLGPLLNPARPPFQLVGVFAQALLQKFAAVFVLLGRTHAWAVHGSNERGGGIDEVSTMGPTEICSVEGGHIHSTSITPEHFGLSRVEAEELHGGDCAANVRTLHGILSGRIKGAKRDVVLFNAAAGFVVCNLAPDLHAGLELARAQLENGRALAKLEALQKFS
ncbi:MAG: anthranilate phosphoribosyltransferase [Chthoniobacter sp.]|nr:anthranilate phosphoribosyltransferase [Chthoniobacter sp.]